MHEEALAQLAILKEKKAEIVRQETQIIEAITAQYSDQLAGKVGTQNIDGIKFHIPKTVKWDQEGLAKNWQLILEAGQDPFEYIKRSFDVAESKYKAWPSSIKETFEPYRTVKPGKVSIKLPGDKEVDE